MGRIKLDGKGPILWAMFMLGTNAMHAQMGWMGDLDQWEIHGDTLALQAPAAGSASAWKCFESNGTGWDVELRWIQDLAGSLNNFSTLHFFRPSSEISWEGFALPAVNAGAGAGYESGVFFKIGATGSVDALEGYQVTGTQPPTLIGSWEAGTWAAGLDHCFRLQADPANDGVAQWSARENESMGPWYWMAEIPWENNPHCIGFQARFTTSNLSAFSLTLNEVMHFSPDTLGPQLVEWMWTGDTLIFQYNEPLSPNEPAVIQWWSGEQTTEWGLPEDRALGLLKTLPPPPPPGVWLELLLPALSDTLGNVGNDSTLTVCHILPGRATWRDLVITEIMADPTPYQGAGPEMEWVEILNRSEEGVDVKDIHWWDAGGGPASILPFPGQTSLLFPGERAILSGVAMVFQGGLKQFLVVGGMNLLDAGDEIGLNHLTGEAIDRVAYEQDWWRGAGGGISLEIQFPGGCDGPANWGPTKQGPQGEGLASTPGLPGQMEVPETEAVGTPLELNALFPQTSHSGWFQFNQPLDPRHFPWVHSGTWGNLSLPEASAGQVQIEANETWEGEHVAFDLRGVSRCIPPQEAPPVQPRQFHWEGEIGYFPRFGDLALTEIAAVPPALATEWGEYVEWENLSDRMLETGSIRVNGASGIQRKLLRPGEREVRSVLAGLPNEKGRVLVTLVGGDTLENVLYSACWHGNARDESAGKSWVRRSLQLSAHEPLNWRTSGDHRGGSPGTIDPGEEPAHGAAIGMDELPRLTFAGIRGDIAVVLSNQPLASVPTDWKPAEPASEDWIAGWGIGRVWEVPAQIWNPDDSITNLRGIRTPALAPQGWMEVVNRIQAGGNGLSADWGEWGWSLNEVLNNPIAGGEPFIEIQWIGSQAGAFSEPLRLSSETITQPADWRRLGPYNWWIPKDKPVAWARCPTRLSAGDHLPAELPSLHGNRLISLSSAPWMLQTDTLLLGDFRHSPWLWDTEGTSLERLEGHTSQAQTRGNIWFSSLAGSTPSDRNSQFAKSFLPDGRALNLSSRTLTPGPSGSKPWIEIQLCAPSTDGAQPPTAPLSIGIYDERGRLQHEVVDAQQVSPAPGVCNQWIWDGRGPHGNYLPAGAYWIVAGDAENRVYAWASIAVAPVR